mmetsp:Transcript_41331/g.133210  ORF Transcript_41331/g.133210 Transcript_41331/m.133210 type:complete len:158 (-) Transcript_41331:17-490(-)
MQPHGLRSMSAEILLGMHETELGMRLVRRRAVRGVGERGQVYFSGAYSCSNGAPFGNAGVSGSVSQASDSSFIGTIYEFRAVAILALVACGLECVFRKPAFAALHDLLWLGLEIMWFWVRFVCLCTCVIIVSMLIFRGTACAREPNGSRLTTPLLQV